MTEHPEESGNVFLDAIKMNLFMNFRTGNYVIDTFITTILIELPHFSFK